ncbi:MAG: CapA family protein [Lachnospiraceae bacterium]|nr:CapA family protein [Lachnospiraceae bacterium]
MDAELPGARQVVILPIGKHTGQFLKESVRLAAAAFLAGAALVLSGYASGEGLPDWIVWESSKTPAEEGDDLPDVLLEDKRLCIFRDGELIWESEPDWLVQDYLLCDIDRDGEKELLTLVWKRGSFGAHRPLWITEDDDAYSQHIFIYDLHGQEEPVRPIWMSSAIPRHVSAMEFSGKEKLLILTDPAGGRQAWRWEYFGLKAAELPNEGTLRILAAGDVIARRQILAAGEGGGGSYDFLFAKISGTIRQADLACVNLETPLVRDGSYSDYPRFASPPAIADAIAGAGFDVVTCATNHMLDQGLLGLTDTEATIRALPGLTCLGIHAEKTAEPPFAVIEKNGIRAALLNFTYGTNGMPIPDEAPHCIDLLTDRDRVLRAVRAAKKEGDIVAVFVHWGTEYAREPDALQKKWADTFLAEGVDLVVGTHPHVLQKAEILTRADGHRMAAYYSLGNLVSAQGETENRLGGIADVTFLRDADGTCRIASASLLPVVTCLEKGRLIARLLTDIKFR